MSPPANSNAVFHFFEKAIVTFFALKRRSHPSFFCLPKRKKETCLPLGGEKGQANLPHVRDSAGFAWLTHNLLHCSPHHSLLAVTFSLKYLHFFKKAT